MSEEERITKPTIETILARINELGASVTSRFESLQAQVQELRTGQEGLQSGVQDLQAGQRELKSELRDFERKIDVLNKNILQVRADQTYILERLLEPETKAS